MHVYVTVSTVYILRVMAILLFLMQLGITNDTAVVLYDNNEDVGMYSVARAWLLFKVGI